MVMRMMMAFILTRNKHMENNIPLNTEMTLKDYFAAAALTGYLAAGASQENGVVWSYRTAERMLKERNK